MPVLMSAQTKVSGVVKDEFGDEVPFANIYFKNSTEGTITNENGRFYLESDTRYQTLIVSFIGYATQEIPLTKSVTYNLDVVLAESGEQLKGVTVYTGRQSKKNNPAIDILRKIWAKKRINGVKHYKQYSYNKYEKIEFDLNTIDSALIKSRLFRGMEFVFKKLDTSRVTGKTYLPIFINEAAYKIYGDNLLSKKKEILLGNKNSGFSDNQGITAFIQDLYADYDIYENHLKIFDKSFVSPLSKTGIDTYNYVLNDSAFIDNKWCYNIVYYPRRTNELTFKGDFWVNDTTYAIKDINLQASKSANVNWVKEIYIEQAFEVVNDSVLLLKRDYMLSDFSLNKKEKSRGIYGKRTTLYDDYVFDQPKPSDFYRKAVDDYHPEAYDRSDTFWKKNRLEKLNKDEAGIYKLLDTLKTVPKFKRMYNIATVLASGYIEISSLNLDYGPIFSTIGFNEAEGFRLRAGGRTYFGRNDLWRIQAYAAYGFKDQRFKYGILAKWLVDKKSRLIFSVGNRRDVEQTAVSLSATTDVLGRSFASSGLSSGSNNLLTNINLTAIEAGFEPFKNIRLNLTGVYKTFKSAIPDVFSIDYINPDLPTSTISQLKQSELSLGLSVTPNRKTLGFGVERREISQNFSKIYITYTKGLEDFIGNGFDYDKFQLYYVHPWQIGRLGRLITTLEMGKTFGEVPLPLLSVVPGNQTYLSIYNTFSLLNFYEFVTDSYTSFHLEHNFNGRIFSRIPGLRKLNLREFIGLRGVWGSISDANMVLNQPAFASLPVNPNAIAPEDRIYYEYSIGVGNIFKVFRIDFNFRGNYFDNPNARSFGVTGSFGFFF